jgi:hypothetical protein
MKATPVLDYTVPESVKTLQEKIHSDDGGDEPNTCTCARSHSTSPICGSSCGIGYSVFTG